MSDRSGRPQEHPVSAAVNGIVHAISDCLRPLATECADAVRRSDAERQARSSALGTFDDICRGLLESGTVLHGLGFSAAPGAFVPGELWMSWWERAADGSITSGSHDLNPSRDTFYDYTDLDWFTSVDVDSELTAVGPYVDFDGTNEYTLTFTLPVSVDGTLLGVVAGDLSVDEFERAILGVLQQSTDPLALVNDDNRVILSTTFDWSTGSLVSRSTADEVDVLDLPSWRLIRQRRA